jgi:uncharacterized membrane protein YdcZ (DUF606 family)
MDMFMQSGVTENLGEFLTTFRCSDAPWYAWIGGICGGYYVIINVLTVPRLGTATVLSIFVCAQVSSAAFSCGIIEILSR